MAGEARKANQSDSQDSQFRTKLAAWIIGLSLVGISSISLAAILFADNRAETTRLVFGSVLPLFGTWVGTVLAFYFARENFAAATESTLRLTRSVTRETPVAQTMIPRADMVVRQLGVGETDASVSIQELTSVMQSKNYKRIPIFDQSGAGVYVVHESLILSFAKQQNVAASDQAFLQKTLADLRSVPELKQLSEALAFVPEKATIGDARDRMLGVNGCNDVFVTASGKPSEAVVGWVTNTLLATVE